MELYFKLKSNFSVFEIIVKLILKFQIMVEGKAQTDLKAEHTRKYSSILNRFATQYSAIRWTLKISF